MENVKPALQGINYNKRVDTVNLNIVSIIIFKTVSTVEMDSLLIPSIKNIVCQFIVKITILGQMSVRSASKVT